MTMEKKFQNLLIKILGLAGFGWLYTRAIKVKRRKW